MKVSFIGQIAGASTLAQELKATLLDPAYNSLRFGVAFARWSGLNLVHHELEKFVSRRDTSVQAVVGVDLGGTTAEALTYLMELPSTTTKILRSGDPRIVFHPKIYVFEGRSGWKTLVGSGNMTAGGLHTNLEASFMVTGTARERNEAGDYLRTLFDARPPLNARHVRLLDQDYLDELAPSLDSYRTPPPDARRRGGKRPLQGSLALSSPLPPIGRPPSPPGASAAGRARRKSGPIPAPSASQTLYLELWDETGGGTQVQLPKDVFTGYFGATETTVTWVELEGPRVRTRVRLQAFPNSTYRIPLAFVRGVRRKAVLRFQRLGPDRYQVDVRHDAQPDYVAWLARCTEQRTPTSKRYGVH